MSLLHSRLTKMSYSNLIYASVCSYLSTFSFGYMIGYSSPALPQLLSAGQPMYKNEMGASWFGSIVTIGAMIGCFISGWMLDKFGRKQTLLCGALPFLLGWLGIWIGANLEVLCFGRFLTGFGSGMACVSAPLYISETSTKDLRGMLGSGVQLSVTIGIVVVYVLGMFLDWRTLALMGAVIPITSVLMTLRAPETPRYLLNTSQRTQALRALLWLRGTSASAEEECRDMEENTDAGEKAGWSDFRRPELYRPLLVSCAVMVFQQLGGVNVVIFYTVSIFQSAGFDKETSGLATIAIGAVQVVGTVIACFLMDRSGRRKLLIVSGMCMALTCFIMGAYYKQIEGVSSVSTNTSTLAPPVANNLGWLAVGSLICYIFAFSVGWGPIPMLLMSEIFPAKVRGTASAVASLVNWTFAFIVTNQFANLTAVIGSHGTFWLFGGFCVLSIVFVFRSVPETKGKSLDDIELYFLGRAIRGI